MPNTVHYWCTWIICNVGMYLYILWECRVDPDRTNALKVNRTKGLRKEFFPKIRRLLGKWVGGWVQVSLGICFENHPKIALNQYWYVVVVYHVYSVCTCIAKSCWLLWFECSVHYYYISVMGFNKKKSLDGGWVGGVSFIQFFWNLFNFAKPLINQPTCSQCIIEINVLCLMRSITSSTEAAAMFFPSTVTSASPTFNPARAAQLPANHKCANYRSKHS